MTLQKRYQNATLSVEKTGMWRICWGNINPATGKIERIRKTFNLNRIADLKERKKAANRIIDCIDEALKLGYNDFVPPAQNAALPAFADLPQVKAAVEHEITLVAALERALKIRTLGVSVRTAHSYRSFVKILSGWLADNDMQTLAVSQFTTEHFQDYLFHKSKLGHGNANLNEHTNFFKTTFNVIRKKLKLIRENPIDYIDYLPEHESTLFEPLTEEEIERIVPALIAYNPRFYLYTRFIPHEFIRPFHITRLKAGDIVYNKDYIRMNGTTTKNRKARRKQLLQSIKDMLQDMGYDQLPGTWYLFGKDFEPSATLYPSLSTRAAEIWKRIVIDGLGINKKMYALKHTSSQYFVNENDNADLKYLQQQLEHHSMVQTEIYLQDKVYKKINETKTNTLKY